MRRKRVKFSKDSLTWFLEFAEYNESKCDSEIKNLEVRMPNNHNSQFNLKN